MNKSLLVLQQCLVHISQRRTLASTQPAKQQQQRSQPSRLAALLLLLLLLQHLGTQHGSTCSPAASAAHDTSIQPCLWYETTCFLPLSGPSNSCCSCTRRRLSPRAAQQRNRGSSPAS
jgi:hypothetical protein